MNRQSVTHFISGHLTLSDAEFDQHYRPAIDAALARGDRFVVGDARGTDALAQHYLFGKTVDVTVYHLFTAPRNNAGFPTVGGFADDASRDAQMTADSDCDIAWVRPGRANSGTAKNLQRRNKGNAAPAGTDDHA